MSQQADTANTAAPAEQLPPTNDDSQDDDFDAGFDLASGDTADDDAADDAGVKQAADSSVAAQEQPGAVSPPAQPAAPAPAAASAPIRDTEPPKQIAKIDEHLQDEFERLQKMSPRSAALAMEDSADGETIRQRLESVGAESADDKAAVIMMQRERHAQAMAQEQQDIEAHNRMFTGTLQKEVPNYYSMITDPNRKVEALAYFEEVYAWIDSKPYAEGAQLMETAQAGRDPAKVADLIKRFESERKPGPEAAAAASKPDPTGALAVPSRGGHVAPSGIGDKDSFDAGFELSTKSKT
jgi:hypothetical protein